MNEGKSMQSTESAGVATRSPKSLRWGFLNASAVVLLVMVAGEAVGRLYEPYWRHLKAGWVEWRASSAGYLPSEALRFGDFETWVEAYLASPGLGARDALLWLFVLSSASLVWMLRAQVLRFLRSMHAGLALVSWTILAVGAGVIVPQIDGFEDPEQRVTAANEKKHFEDFAWAEAFFLYHLTHLYGIGMPEQVRDPVLPAQALEGLERFRMVYGTEERDNRFKQMELSFAQREKNVEIEAFLERHHDALRSAFHWCTALSLNRAYKSWWFLSLMCLLFAAVTANLFKLPVRAWFRVDKAGFALTHLGLMVTLAGGGISKAFTDRGILQLDLREPPQDTYFRHYTDSKLGRLPFALRLDHFGRRDWEALEVWFPNEEFSSNPPRYTLWPGRKLELDYAPDPESGELAPRIALEVLELHARAKVHLPKVSEGGPQAPELPLVEVQVPDIEALANTHQSLQHEAREGGTRRLYLAPQLQNRGYNDPERAFRLVSDFGSADPGRLFPREEGVLGLLSVEVIGANDGAPVEVPVRIGSRASLPGGFQVEFLRATSNFQLRRASESEEFEEVVDPRPLGQQPLGTRMVKLRLIPPGGEEMPEERVVLEGFDMRQHGKQESYLHAEVLTNFSFDTWRAPGPPRYVLQWGGGAPRLIDEQGRAQPVAAGQPLPISGGGALVPLGFYERAQLEKHIEFLPDLVGEDGWDEDFYARDPRGVLLAVTHFPGTEREVREEVRMATTEASSSHLWWSGDERFVLHFLENSEMMPFEWRSVLSVVERDGDGNPRTVPLGSKRAREIRVNDYFHYEGYRFFQTDARSDIPTYSGIGVVYDPGIPVVTVGMWLMIFGMAAAFLLKPIALLRRKESHS